MLSQVQGQDKALAMLHRVATGVYTSPLLLVGSDGVGRRFSVTCLARQMFCTGTHDVTCTCLHCTQMQHKAHRDFLVVQPEENKSIGIEDARQIVSEAGAFPVLSPVRVILIDGADRMTSAAGNALLKTIEEPTAHVRIFLTANSLEGVLPTIRSRCGTLQYQALPESFVLSVLQGIESSPMKALALVRLAEGSAGLAIQFWKDGRLKLRDAVLDLLQDSINGNLRQIFSAVKGVEEEIPLCVQFMLSVLRDLHLLGCATANLVNMDVLDKLQALQQKLSTDKAALLYSGLQALLTRQRNTSINLPFHLKTLLATTFV